MTLKKNEMQSVMKSLACDTKMPNITEDKLKKYLDVIISRVRKEKEKLDKGIDELQNKNKTK
jgi:hypothetical protein